LISETAHTSLGEVENKNEIGYLFERRAWKQAALARGRPPEIMLIAPMPTASVHHSKISASATGVRDMVSETALAPVGFPACPVVGGFERRASYSQWTMKGAPIKLTPDVLQCKNGRAAQCISSMELMEL
jgi:hypothetical protein